MEMGDTVDSVRWLEPGTTSEDTNAIDKNQQLTIKHIFFEDSVFFEITDGISVLSAVKIVKQMEGFQSDCVSSS